MNCSDHAGMICNDGLFPNLALSQIESLFRMEFFVDRPVKHCIECGSNYRIHSFNLDTMARRDQEELNARIFNRFDFCI